MVETGRSVGDVLDAGAAVLRDAGVGEPARESLRLWAGLAQRSIGEVVLRRDEVQSTTSEDRFREAIRRRASGEPLAYVTGWTGFRRLTLRCDRRALIPRPETEGLVDAALGRVRGGVAADIGTGTGAIALALSDEGSYSRVFGVDISRAALALSAENVAVTGVSVTLLEGDLVATLPGPVDLLVSNPPYLTESEYVSLDRSVRDYEPDMALRSGPDGLQLTVRLLDEARAVVAAGGWIALEVDCNRAVETGRIASRMGWQEVTVLDDLFGRARYVLARQGSGS